jgi:ribosomal protein S18 acetylase RimI-like enzyme
MSALSDIAHKQEICREILSTLPELGDDIDTLEALTTALGPLDVFIEFDGDAALGFIALKARSPTAIDIFAIAVRRAAQRRGIGSHLIASAVHFCQDHGAEYLWAALPQQTRSGRAAAKAQAFYQAHDFRAQIAGADDTQTAHLWVKNITAPGPWQILNHIGRRWTRR